MLDTDPVGTPDGRPAHSVAPRLPVVRRTGAIAGVAAVIIAVAVAVPTLTTGSTPQAQTPAASTVTTARLLTVTVPQAVIPLTDTQLLELLDKPAELGGLDNSARLRSCLDGLGYPSDTAVLGGTAVEINGRPAVVLLLAADDPGWVNALAVAPQCSAALTGLVADTSVPRQ